MKKPNTWLNVSLLGCVLLGGIACIGAAQDKPSTKSDGEVVARIGDQLITLEELDEKAVSVSLQPYQALYDARRGVLENMIAERLFEKEAKARGIEVRELVAAEITQKTTPVTDAEIEAFYNQNRGRMRGQTLEQMSGQIRNYLTQQSTAVAQKAFVDQLKKKMSVTISLDAPRRTVVVAENERTMGPANAAVTIVEFADFQ
jgi:hypothetical protein